MFIKSYTSKDYTIDEVQFALALAVSSFVESDDTDVVKFVLSYNTSGLIRDVTKDKSSVNYEEACNSDWHSRRMELVKSLKATGTGMVGAYLNHVYKQKVYKKKTSLSVGTGYTKSEVSLKDLLPKITINMLYERTMQILYAIPLNQMIISFMDTELFFKEFTNYLNNVHGEDKFKVRNDYSIAKVRAIINEVKAVLRRNLGNDPYSYDGNNPTAFIAYYYSNMFIKSHSETITKILNGRGLFSNVTEDSTVIDYITEDSAEDDYTEPLLNFKELVSDIYIASNTLFNHNSLVFDDIFSIYKEERIKKRFDSIEKSIKSISNLNIEFIPTTADYTTGDSETMKSKARGRRQISDIFTSKILEGGIRKEEIIDLYYECSDVTNTISTKNGARVFMGRESSKNTGGSTDSQKMKIIVDGYVALAELIQYLDKTSDVTGISVINFPTDIFRDASLCRRFTDIRTYVDTIELSQKLGREAYNDPNDGITLNNDEVFDAFYSMRIEDNAKKQQSKTMSKFWDMSLETLTDMIGKEEEISLNTEVLRYKTSLSRELVDVFGESFYSKKINNLPTNKTIIKKGKEYSGPGLDSLHDVLFWLYTFFVKFKDKTEVSFTETDKLNYLEAFIELYNHFGVPIVNEDKTVFELPKNVTLIERINQREIKDTVTLLLSVIKGDYSVVGEMKGVTAPEFSSKNILILAYQQGTKEVDADGKAVNYLDFRYLIPEVISQLTVLFGIDTTEKYMDEDIILSLITSTCIMYVLADKLRDVIKKVNNFGDEKNIYLFYAQMAKELYDFQIPVEIKSLKDLHVLFRWHTIDSRKNLDYTMYSQQHIRQRASLMSNSLSNMLNWLPNLFKFIKLCDAGISTELKIFDDYSKINPEFEAQFLKASQDIRVMLIKDNNGKVAFPKESVMAMAPDIRIDDLGYYLIKGRRYREEGNVYFHSSGYKVQIKVVNSVVLMPVISKITVAEDLVGLIAKGGSRWKK